MDPESLVEQARRGNRAATGALIEANHRIVYAACFRVLRRDAEALDATQETFLRAFARLEELRDAAALAPWLRRIALNTARNVARAQRRTLPLV